MRRGFCVLDSSAALLLLPEQRCHIILLPVSNNKFRTSKAMSLRWLCVQACSTRRQCKIFLQIYLFSFQPCCRRVVPYAHYPHTEQTSAGKSGRFCYGRLASNLSDIEDEYHYLYSQYVSAFKLHKMKYSNSILGILVTIGDAFTSSLLKGKLFSAIKGLIDIKSAKINLLEEEGKFPGKEIAYIHSLNQELLG